MNDVTPVEQPPQGSEEGLVAWTHVIYALHAISALSGMLTPVTIVSAFATGWPSIIAVILNYLKRDEARGTFLESHFRWQIRTFWFTLMWLGVIVLLWLTLLGIPIAIAMSAGVGIWVLYRVIRGWMTLQKGKAIFTGVTGAQPR
jgi:uncharacterized membrane protein